MTDRNVQTIRARGANRSAPENRPASLPIYLSSGWEFDSPDHADAVFTGQAPGTPYGNRGTPNHAALEGMIAELEGAPAAAVSSGGMAAIASVLFALLSPGDAVVAGRDLFGVTNALLEDVARWNVIVRRVDTTRLDDVVRALAGGARMIYTETISNPHLRVADLRALADAAHDVGALCVVDNTLASPVHCRPATLGVDVVIESVTKMMAGHHDVILGSVAGAREVTDRVRAFMYRVGTRPSAFDAWLAARGLGTLVIRQERAASTALIVARWLVDQPHVNVVHYPGLPSHPDHDTAVRQLSRGYGSVIAVEIDGGREAVTRLLAATDHITLVHSLGGLRTTLSHAATMTHRNLSPAERAGLGLGDGFLRLAIGLEDPADIIDDLSRGLCAVGRAPA